MTESTPGAPYKASIAELLRVESNMRERRSLLQSVLGADEAVLTVTSFPRMGVGHFTVPAYDAGGPVAASLFTPDEAINEHPRFPTLTANIRERRGSNVAINVPVFVDEKTGDPNEGYDVPAAAKEGHIYMDSMAFGMGCCCVQVTFQACDIEEARGLYDQLAIICPYFMALTAASPAYRGYLADVDCRWNVIAASVDDRTPFERGLEATPPTDTAAGWHATTTGDVASSTTTTTMTTTKHTEDAIVTTTVTTVTTTTVTPRAHTVLAELEDGGESSATSTAVSAPGSGHRARVIAKSRYDSIDSYLSQGETSSDVYGDIDLVYDEDTFRALVDGGVDEVLARHIAHLWIREPLVVMEGLIDEVNDDTSTIHFENLQSTNWQTVRFKPPPPGSPIGWRVEFRPMEVQFTDFENAAFSIFVVLLTRVILSYSLDFYIPLSKVDDNIQRAQQRDAVNQQSFHFRANVFGGADTDSTVELSADEIFNGTPADSDGNVQFPGLIPITTSYLDSLNLAFAERKAIQVYLDFIAGRASGKYLTNAAFIRSFVTSHPEYAKDSVVTDAIQYDLLTTISSIADGTLFPPELFGDLFGGE